MKGEKLLIVLVVFAVFVIVIVGLAGPFLFPREAPIQTKFMGSPKNVETKAEGNVPEMAPLVILVSPTPEAAKASVKTMPVATGSVSFSLVDNGSGNADFVVTNTTAEDRIISVFDEEGNQKAQNCEASGNSKVVCFNYITKYGPKSFGMLVFNKSTGKSETVKKELRFMANPGLRFNEFWGNVQPVVIFVLVLVLVVVVAFVAISIFMGMISYEWNAPSFGTHRRIATFDPEGSGSIVAKEFGRIVGPNIVVGGDHGPELPAWDHFQKSGEMTGLIQNTPNGEKWKLFGKR